MSKDKFFLSDKEVKDRTPEEVIPECVRCEFLVKDCPMEQKKGKGCLYFQVRHVGR